MAQVKNNILFITLSNIGDVILTTPVLWVLKNKYPDAKLNVLVGPKAAEIFQGNPNIHSTIIYDKHMSLSSKLSLVRQLRKIKFDLVVDLRNTILPFLLRARKKIGLLSPAPKGIHHKKQIHLWKLKSLGIDIDMENVPFYLYYSKDDLEYAKKLLNTNGIPVSGRIVAVCPGARSTTKMWSAEGFAKVIDELSKLQDVKVILIGDIFDRERNYQVSLLCQAKPVDLSGKTSLMQLAALISLCNLLITNDSAPMHIATAIGVPVISLFGPTDPQKYGPQGKSDVIIRKQLDCSPCEKAQCKYKHECMELITPQEVIEAAKKILSSPQSTPHLPPTTYYLLPKRILLVRTDRIGDVLLSTPAIKAVRDAYPDAYIAIMVSPYAKEIVEGNPYLDEIIVYDKNGKQKGIFGNLKFILRLRKKRFDMALILHPAVRIHLVIYLSGIPERIGYDKKAKRFLTAQIPYVKRLGKKHETEYTLDILRAIGIQPQEKELFMPQSAQAQRRIENLLIDSGITDKQKIITVHPGASCPSKIWPPERFAKLTDSLVKIYNLKPILISGPTDVDKAKMVLKFTQTKPVTFFGNLNLKELAALLKRSSLFISNDSGPVHIACAVKTPVIAIFGRNESGLSPTRWGPSGSNDVILHKDVGCKVCLAHDCKEGFACLMAISVEDVLNAVKKFEDRLK